MPRRTKTDKRRSPTEEEIEQIRTYLTTRSGYFRAEAVGVLLAKAIFLGLAATFGVLAVLSTRSEYLQMWERLVLVVLCVVVGALLVRYTLRVGYSFGALADRIGRRGRFRRMRGSGVAADARADVAPSAITADAITLRSSLRGQGPLFFRIVLFAVLALPAVVLSVYVVLSYLAPLWNRLRYGPVADGPSWDEPENFTGLGGMLFDDDLVIWTVLVMLVSAVFVMFCVALLSLMIGRVNRGEADALDLAVGDRVTVRGGLSLSWTQIAEVLVIEDIRTSGNPCRIRNHSRTRIALVLEDLPDVAAHADRDRRRALYAAGDGLHGYALCDLWSHDPAQAADAVVQLERSARRARRLVAITRVPRGNSNLWASRYLI